MNIEVNYRDLGKYGDIEESRKLQRVLNLVFLVSFLFEVG